MSGGAGGAGSEAGKGGDRVGPVRTEASEKRPPSLPNIMKNSNMAICFRSV